MEAIKQGCAWAQFRLKSTQIFIVAGTVVLTLLITLLCIGFTMRYEVQHEVANVADVDYWKDHVSAEQQIWYDKGIEELNTALTMHANLQHPRNVLIMLANGISAEQLAAARFSTAKGRLVHSEFLWDQFPHVARLSSSCSVGQPCDAGSLATALFGGVSSRGGTVGLDAAVPFGNCSAALDTKHHVMSIMRQAQLAGLRTGFVTTQRLTGAMGAGLYAHAPDSSWECDQGMPQSAKEAGCEDIAQQLFSSETGKAFNVLLGGGRQMLRSDVDNKVTDELDGSLYQATDGRNLLQDWREEKLQQGAKLELVQELCELKSTNVSQLTYLLGVLSNGDLGRSSMSCGPALQLMLSKSLQLLSRHRRGYLLLAEQLVKAGQKHQPVTKLQAFNDTLTRLLQKPDIEHTLILVVFARSNFFRYGQEVTDEDLQQLPSDSVVFARGPKSLLFHGIRDETYLAHAVAYALGIGAFNPNGHR